MSMLRLALPDRTGLQRSRRPPPLGAPPDGLDHGAPQRGGGAAFASEDRQAPLLRHQRAAGTLARRFGYARTPGRPLGAARAQLAARAPRWPLGRLSGARAASLGRRSGAARALAGRHWRVEAIPHIRWPRFFQEGTGVRDTRGLVGVLESSSMRGGMGAGHACNARASEWRWRAAQRPRLRARASSLQSPRPGLHRAASLAEHTLSWQPLSRTRPSPPDGRDLCFRQAACRLPRELLTRVAASRTSGASLHTDVRTTVVSIGGRSWGFPVAGPRSVDRSKIRGARCPDVSKPLLGIILAEWLPSLSGEPIFPSSAGLARELQAQRQLPSAREANSHQDASPEAGVGQSFKKWLTREWKSGHASAACLSSMIGPHAGRRHLSPIASRGVAGGGRRGECSN